MKLGVFVSDFKLTTDTLARYGIPSKIKKVYDL